MELTIKVDNLSLEKIKFLSRVSGFSGDKINEILSSHFSRILDQIIIDQTLNSLNSLGIKGLDLVGSLGIEPLKSSKEEKAVFTGTALKLGEEDDNFDMVESLGESEEKLDEYDTVLEEETMKDIATKNSEENEENEEDVNLIIPGDDEDVENSQFQEDDIENQLDSLLSSSEEDEEEEDDFDSQDEFASEFKSKSNSNSRVKVASDSSGGGGGVSSQEDILPKDLGLKGNLTDDKVATAFFNILADNEGSKKGSKQRKTKNGIIY